MQEKFSHYSIEAGCDEAGRGCLAGPVFAAAVILDPKKSIIGLDDSKKLSETARVKLRLQIEKDALVYAIAMVLPTKIEEINILWSSILAMHLALDKLKISPEFISVDGNKFRKYKEIPHQCLIKGDANYQNIAAASILAKTYRDDFMEKIHAKYPHYNWRKNKGYPTKEHRKGILEKGVCVWHRNTFRLLPDGV